jgi:hypothetical protein
VESLELRGHSYKHASGPMVLVARSEHDLSLYVIERVSRGIYALCKLSSSADVDDMSVCASTLIPTDDHLDENGRDEACFPEPWWKVAVSRHDLPDNENARKRRRTAGVNGASICLKRSSFELQRENVTFELPSPIRDTTQLVAPKAGRTTAQVQYPVVDSELTNVSQPQPLDPLQMIREQYLEALYISKTSLAYFAKGPLSRARAMLKDENGSSSASGRLVDFLQDCILPLTLSDKKYRETLPDMVDGLPGAGLSDDDMTQLSGKLRTSKKKGRKSKTARPGKNGLFATEEGYIARWWKTEDADLEAGTSMDSRDDIMRKKIAKLRTRETQLQMIIILEILAVQSVPLRPEVNSTEKATNCEISCTPTRDDKPKKKSKTSDPGLTLELLLDRLCIWQTLTPEENLDQVNALAASRTTSKTGAKAGLVEQELSRPKPSVTNRTDPLGDFCVEVIIPL